ncbi:UPF0149 family protein [Thalassotalea piscium]|uniref:YecA family protein n=1 Tax=Thalassotalea piscium TaxID=1230533 RepID=A0A7X0NIP2_9GAMM|nr:UPF0149 family protein [Thalassotalea piscium]MBB6544182.1 hypothetical protein [Thalassotalea piscium]
MADESSLDFASVQAIITTENVKAHAAEVHGVLTGLVCAGYSFESNDYINLINDMLNNGEGLPNNLKDTIKILFSEVWQTILDDSYGFKLLLPDDDDSIEERGHALGIWVQGFNLGFGLQQKNQKILSDDVKEILTDFGEIANLSDEFEDDEATEQAYYEISEYVRMSALVCFTELGSPPVANDKPEVLH